MRLGSALAVLLACVAACAAGTAGAAPSPRGDAPSTARGVTSPEAPAPPAPYALPAGAVRVTSAAELEAALEADAPRDIVLADGTYETDGWFRNASGHRLFAEHLGGAVLASGLEIGGNWGAGGALVRGVVFDVRDETRTFGGALVHVWGPAGAATRISDCVLLGNRAVAYGVLAYNPDGLVAERLVLRGFTDVALRASDNEAVPYGAWTPKIQRIADISVDGVSRPQPGASGGTAEAGLWIGHPVVEGVRRIRVRNVSWAGMETVNNAWDTTYSDLDIDMRGPQAAAAIGIYLEHFNHRNVFQRFEIRGAATGINAEWADPAWGGVAGSHGTVISDGLIDAAGAEAAKTYGVYLDEGTESTTVQRVRFRNQSFAAIGAYKVVGTNRFEGNDTRGLLPGARALSDAHWSSPQP